MRRIPQVDALRAMAILLVLVGHVAKNAPALHLMRIAHYCFSGVDLFFVLSGFLITGILISTKQNDSFLKTFYIRRALRIWPLYFGVLALWFIVTIPASALHHSIIEQTRPQWAYPVFIQNLVVPYTGTFGPLQITWSLCVEEQFYLVWPLLVLLCDRKWLIGIAFSAVILSVFFRFGSHAGYWQLDIYQNTLCRMDAIASGCLIALLDFRRVGTAKKFLPVAVGVIVAGSAFRSVEYIYPLGCALLFASMLVIAKDCQNAFWSNRFLVHTGEISYGLYMLHLIAYDSVRSALTHHSLPSDLLLAVFSIAGAYLIAEASWNFYERPFLKLKSVLTSAGVARANTTTA